jgi:tetratricopeptide (TPR) repeat protein
MMRAMQRDDAALVEIVRNFLAAHRLTREIAARCRSGELRFAEVTRLVGDSEESVLYRLKESCHGLFRRATSDGDVRMRREALFDLAVGSLFHEAMKFRENFYQREVYGPKVRALRSAASGEADQLFREFEKILSAASVRLDEALQETESLLVQTREQCRALLTAHSNNGLLARYLLENRAGVEDVFDSPLEDLLRDVYGDAAAGFALAGRSYLESGHFGRARDALETAMVRTGRDADLLRDAAYARGMEAYLDGRYPVAVEAIGAWLEASPSREHDAPLGALAQSALARVGRAEQSADAATAAAAAALADRIASWFAA